MLAARVARPPNGPSGKCGGLIASAARGSAAPAFASSVCPDFLYPPDSKIWTISRSSFDNWPRSRSQNLSARLR